MSEKSKNKMYYELWGHDTFEGRSYLYKVYKGDSFSVSSRAMKVDSSESSVEMMVKEFRSIIQKDEDGWQGIFG